MKVFEQKVSRPTKKRSAYRVEEADLGGGIDLHVRREPIARRALVVVVVQPVVREGSLMADPGVAPVAGDRVARKGVAGRVWRAAWLAAEQRRPGGGVEDGVLDDDVAGAGRALEGNRRVEDACTAHRTAHRSESDAQRCPVTRLTQSVSLAWLGRFRSISSVRE